MEDERNIRELIVYTLESSGFTARGLESGKELNAAIAEQLPDLILLDIMLPGEDGLEILSRLKASEVTKEIPVIMVTAKGAEYDKVMGLDCGADDYITKPFGMMEFIARVRAVLRRAGKEEKENDVLETGDLQIQVKQHQVTIILFNPAFLQKRFKVRGNLNPVLHQLLFRTKRRRLQIFPVEHNALRYKSIFRFACAAAEIVCFVLRVSILRHPQFMFC